MAYFSLNGGQSSWSKDACKAFTKMGAVGSPSPSPSPIVSPSPSPLSKPNFQIRKFNDLDGDGEKDANEGSVNRAWGFQYKINDGDWIAISTVAGTGLSAKMAFAKDTKVEVEELTELNWRLTTAQKQTKTLSVAGQTYTFNFGNKQVDPSASPGSGGTVASPSPSPSPSVSPSLSPSPSPSSSPSQPDTGTPTWLTAGALLTGLGLLMIKLLLKI